MKSVFILAASSFCSCESGCSQAPSFTPVTSVIATVPSEGTSVAFSGGMTPGYFSYFCFFCLETGVGEEAGTALPLGRDLQRPLRHPFQQNDGEVSGREPALVFCLGSSCSSCCGPLSLQREGCSKWSHCLGFLPILMGPSRDSLLKME